jgi:hypothetical protein
MLAARGEALGYKEQKTDVHSQAAGGVRLTVAAMRERMPEDTYATQIWIPSTGREFF